MNCQKQAIVASPNAQGQGMQALRNEAYTGVHRSKKTRDNNQLMRLNIGKPTVEASPNAQGQGAQGMMNEAYIEVRRSEERRRGTPKLGIWGSHKGFSYIGVLMAVAIAGIAMTAANRYWSTLVLREREAELLFRGYQIQTAIGSYYENPPGGQSKQYPRAIADLLRDPRYPQTRRHLRQWYSDPLTGESDWALIRDAGGRIKGVHSQHQGKPLKSGNFIKELSAFEMATSYSDWKFVYTPKGN
jgi:type II secretory pathway pseudopilin PulG